MTRVAIATQGFSQVSRHAGRAREWIVAELAGEGEAFSFVRITLAAEEILHLATEDKPHPLDGVELFVAGSAGEGFVRHMARRGAEVVLTGETDPQRVCELLSSARALPEPGFDPTRVLCRIRDLFSRH
ncbi:MAG: hypothetical protein KDG55_11865 [Rhodocyclaceae bacterium]|nr:hypothetical protein [Rhodocyclaceae bacterium]